MGPLQRLQGLADQQMSLQQMAGALDQQAGLLGRQDYDRMRGIPRLSVPRTSYPAPVERSDKSIRKQLQDETDTWLAPVTY